MSEVAPQPVLRVRARWPRRRAGFAFGPEPRVLTADDFGDDEIEVGRKVVAIATDRVLKVEVPVSVEGDTVEWSEITDDAVEAFIDRLALLEMDTLGAAGASASSDADVTTSTRENGGDADNQPSVAAPSEPVAADQHDVATAPEPTTTQFPKAAPSGRKAKAKPATAD